MLRRIIRKLLHPEEKKICDLVVFKDKYGNQVCLEKVSNGECIYIDVCVNWFSWSVFRLNFESFSDNLVVASELKELIISKKYEQLEYDWMVVRLITSLPNIGAKAQKIYAKFVLLNDRKNRPVMELYLSNEGGKFFFLMNLRDRLEGNISKISVEDALSISEALLSFSQESEVAI